MFHGDGGARQRPASIENAHTTELCAGSGRLDKDQVRRLLGKPRLVSGFCHEEGRGVGLAPCPRSERRSVFNIHFAENGLVSTTSRSVQHQR